MVLHSSAQDPLVRHRHQGCNSCMSQSGMLGLSFGMNFQEEPFRERSSLWFQNACIEFPESIEHPSLLIISKVLNGQVISQGIGCQLQGSMHSFTRPTQILHHFIEQNFRKMGLWIFLQHVIQRLAHQI